ncbi:MAG: riboflavin synthase [Candidatus Omnitrophota bacterium]
MFTGIIEEVGKVVRIENRRGLRSLTVEAPAICAGLKVGDSVSVNGVCLTIIRIFSTQLSFEVMTQTLQATDLKDLKLQDKVNLERALRADGRLNGHFVLGHVDGVGIVRRKSASAGNAILEIAIDKSLAKYLIPKGSIAVEGVSLTIGKVAGNVFSVNLIPHTSKNTNLGNKPSGSTVNIEIDMLAKRIDPSTSLRVNPEPRRGIDF